MTDRVLLEKVLEAMEHLNRTGDTQVFDLCYAPELIPALRERLAQREGLTPEERKRRCGELLVQAQYMDSKEYLRWMNDSTKRPWVGLTDEEIEVLEVKHAPPVHPDVKEDDWWEFARAIEAKLKEKNNG